MARRFTQIKTDFFDRLSKVEARNLVISTKEKSHNYFDFKIYVKMSEDEALGGAPKSSHFNKGKIMQETQFLNVCQAEPSQSPVSSAFKTSEPLLL